MNTEEIEHALKEYRHFDGVFPADLIPKPQKYPYSVIVNYDTSQFPGTHWICFFLPSKYKCEYFDSFGFKPLNIYFIEFIKNFTNNAFYYYNPIRLQNNSSSVCGYYCISYVSNRLKGISPSKILKKLNYGDTKLNDCKVYTNISKKFRIKKKLSRKQTCCTFKVFKRKLKE